MSKKMRDQKPKIFWQDEKFVVCQRFDGKYQLCFEDKGNYYYTKVIDKTVEAVVTRRNEHEQRI